MTSKSTKRFTLAAYEHGEGTKQQRAQFEKLGMRSMPYIAARLRTMANAAQALVQATGATIEPDDDLTTLIERVRDDPRAAPILVLLKELEDAMQTVQWSQNAQQRAAKKPRAPRCSVTPEMAREFVAEFESKHGKRRGAICAGAAHFGISGPTFSGLLHK
jgi:hypothetical protein